MTVTLPDEIAPIFQPIGDETKGLAIHAYQPTIDPGVSYTPTGRLISDTLGSEGTGYSHEITADDGWWSASLSLTGTVDEMESWFNDGLNRHIEIYNPDMEKIFEGFVNQITYSAGTLTADRGPLMDIANRVSVLYTPILSGTESPPITGTQTSTTIADNTVSQAKYGIIEKIFQAGQLYPDAADNLRDSYLADMAWPETSESIATGSTSEPTISIQILGYVHRLNCYVVQDITAVSVQLSDSDGTGKMQLLLADDPNGLFSTDYSQMEDNGELVQRYENENRTAWTAIKQL